ncbi:MAG: hypothetical protein HS118_07050 [Bacteroidia bacterium]|nr:hypothetical protein [Bacteroidia bacterium]
MHLRLQTRKAKIYKNYDAQLLNRYSARSLTSPACEEFDSRIKNANKFIIGAGIAYNLKKYMLY